MYFKEIELKNFRNYKHIKKTFHDKVNILIGENGNGKTNLVESIYMTCFLRSFRTAKDREMIQFGEEQMKIQAIVQKEERELKVEIFLNQKEKVIKINGVKKKRADLLENIHIVIFSPEDLKIVKEEPDLRRRFLNRELSQMKPGYYKNLYRYTKVLEQRNSLLKQEKVDSMLFDVWNEELIHYGIKIMQDRCKLIEKLNMISKEIHDQLTEGKENLEIRYDSNIELKEDIGEQKLEFERALNKNFEKDLYRHTTTCGPHRDDLKIMINEIDARTFGSQGQQRTASLSLKLAEIQLIQEETGETPVLILDDVLSELDLNRQYYLVDFLKNKQLFLTTAVLNDKIIEKIPDHQIYNVKNGSIFLLEDF